MSDSAEIDLGWCNLVSRRIVVVTFCSQASCGRNFEEQVIVVVSRYGKYLLDVWHGFISDLSMRSYVFVL